MCFFIASSSSESCRVPPPQDGDTIYDFDPFCLTTVTGHVLINTKGENHYSNFLLFYSWGRYNEYYFLQRLTQHFISRNDLSPSPPECGCDKVARDRDEQDGKAGEHHRVHGALQDGDHRWTRYKLNIFVFSDLNVSFQQRDRDGAPARLSQFHLEPREEAGQQREPQQVSALAWPLSLSPLSQA